MSGDELAGARGEFPSGDRWRPGRESEVRRRAIMAPAMNELTRPIIELMVSMSATEVSERPNRSRM